MDNVNGTPMGAIGWCAKVDGQLQPELVSATMRGVMIKSIILFTQGQCVPTDAWELPRLQKAMEPFRNVLIVKIKLEEV